MIDKVRELALKVLYKIDKEDAYSNIELNEQIKQNRKNSITKNDKISKKDIAIWKRCVYTLNDRNKEL